MFKKIIKKLSFCSCKTQVKKISTIPESEKKPEAEDK